MALIKQEVLNGEQFMNYFEKAFLCSLAVTLSQIPTTDESGMWMADVPVEDVAPAVRYVADLELPAATGVAPANWQNGLG